MNRSDHERFSEVLQGVYSFYRADLSTFHVEVWWAAMKPFSFDAVRDAFNRHLVNPDNGQFLPKPADLCKLIDGGTVEKALLAWSKFEAAVSHVGCYQSVAFDDPIIHAVAHDMGGWPLLCAKEIKDWPFTKNEFVTRYRAYSMKPLLSYPRWLIGKAEGDNAQRGHPVEPPLMVGDEARARLVIQNGALERPITGRVIGELLGNSPSQLLAEK